MSNHHQTQEIQFKSLLPENLYKNHYELNRDYPLYSPDEWRIYTKSEEQFIMNEITAITEASSREALSRLAHGSLTSADITGITRLLERSEQINKQAQDTRTFVVTSFDPKTQEEHQSEKDKMMAQMQENSRNVRTFFNLEDHMSEVIYHRRLRDGQLVQNTDGTLHFAKEEYISDTDKTYLRLFNPENERIIDLEIPEEASDVQ